MQSPPQHPLHRSPKIINPASNGTRASAAHHNPVTHRRGWMDAAFVCTCVCVCKDLHLFPPRPPLSPPSPPPSTSTSKAYAFFCVCVCAYERFPSSESVLVQWEIWQHCSHSIPLQLGTYFFRWWFVFRWKALFFVIESIVGWLSEEN